MPDVDFNIQRNPVIRRRFPAMLASEAISLYLFS